MSINELLQEKREDILRIAAKRGAYNVRVFGSVARGESDSKSDIDILVDMEPGRSLFDLGGLLMDLQDLLDHNVDVLTERGLRERIREQVLKEAVTLWEAVTQELNELKHTIDIILMEEQN
jgi:predicted nucleotidyltransferase